MARWGRIDVLVNSAGHGPRGPILEITDEDWHAGIDVYLMNVDPRRRGSSRPSCRRRSRGAIVNISTAWAFEPSADVPDLGGRSARGSPPSPSSSPTLRRRQRAHEQRPAGLDRQPAGRPTSAATACRCAATARVEEIAATIAFLASDGAGYITGQNIRVDGGLMRSI